MMPIFYYAFRAQLFVSLLFHDFVFIKEKKGYGLKGPKEAIDRYNNWGCE